MCTAAPAAFAASTSCTYLREIARHGARDQLWKRLRKRLWKPLLKGLWKGLRKGLWKRLWKQLWKALWKALRNGGARRALHVLRAALHMLCAEERVGEQQLVDGALLGGVPA